MTVQDPRQVVGAALGLLAPALQVFVGQVLTPLHDPWPELLCLKDARPGQLPRSYNPADPAVLLRVLTERLGEHGHPFTGRLPGAGRAYAEELRQHRNAWAHHEVVDLDRAQRAVQTAALLAREIGAIEAADAIAMLHPSATGEPAIAVHDTTAPVPMVGTGRGTAGTAGSALGAAVTLRCVDTIAYALAHCAVRVVEAIEVIHATGLTGAVVEVAAWGAVGPLGRPSTVRVDLLADRPVSVDLDVRLDPAVMAGVDEQQPGVVQAVLRDADGAVVARAAHDVTVLPAHHWTARPTQLGLELLAVHVQPNASPVQALLRESAELLAARTGSGALAARDADPERVDAVVEAIYDAMRARGVQHALPPASWGVGQKVRRPDQVLETGLGTCLDTTVTLAAALEQAGVRPLVWLLNDHAFLGYWRAEPCTTRVATQDVRRLLARVDAGPSASSRAPW